MKILLYTYDIMKIGGIETSFYNLAKYLKNIGYDVGVRYSICSPDQLTKYIDSGIDISKEHKEVCDILIVGSVWKRPKNIVSRIVVQQVHADYSDSFWNGAIAGSKMIAEANNDVDIFCAASDSSANFVRNIVSKPVLTMYNLAPKHSYINKKDHDNMVFSAFTRMTLEKGLKNYQKFRDRILELGIKAEFRVYTNGKVPEGWTLHEPVTDIKTEMSDVDFVVSLADTECFGYTIAEANSCNVPCIIKRCNSTSEFFTDDNLILDDVTKFNEKDLCRKINKYNLYNRTKKNIDSVIEELESMIGSHVIISSMKRFYDLKAKTIRSNGDLFSVDIDRANELLSNKNNIVRKYDL